MVDSRTAILAGAKAAHALHRDLGIKEQIERSGGGRVDVFCAIAKLGATLMFQPLDKLLGAYLPGDEAGVLITTKRPLPVQRFTGAHELGHLYMRHEPSLDDENILRRSPFSTSGRLTRQEREADAFASMFLAPAWSHKDLARNPYANDIEQAKAEIEMGISAVHMAAGGGKVAPFFRFPALQHPPQLLSYLAERNIGVFSTDINFRDFKLHKPEDVIKSVMSQLEKHGKGIILIHDFKHHTAEAIPELIRQLKAGGYKIVHMVPKGELTTVPKYDEMLSHEDKLSSNNTRPESSVIRTIGE